MHLREYQKVGVAFLRSQQRAILADEMGVGKTPQLIRAAQGRTLVVAPPPLQRNWQDELEVWADDPERFHVVSYHGTVDRTKKDGRGHVRGVIATKARGPWDTVIFDEAHHLKGRNTGYARAGVKLANQTDLAFFATGTPIQNWAYEIFMLLRGLYPGDKRFSSFWRWADTWFSVEEATMWRGKKRVTRREVGQLRSITTWEVFIRENGIAERWLRRTLDDPEVGAELPPVQRIRLRAKMSGHHLKVYRSMQNNYWAEWEGKKLISISDGSKWANLMRLSSGAAFHPEFETEVGSSKLDLLIDLVMGNEGPFLVFCWYQFSADVIEREMRRMGYSTKVAHGGRGVAGIHEFQAGEGDVLIGTYATMGEGHNLTRANKTILFEAPMKPSQMEQAISRTRRIGQDTSTPCVVWQITTADTVEDYFVDRVLTAKASDARGFVDAASLAEYLGK